MADQNSNAFIGKGWAFPPRFSTVELNNDMVKGGKDISESLYIILTTIPGERVMFPNFGCGINKLVFSEVNETQFTVMKNIIQNSILLYEQRIDLNKIDIVPDSDNIDLLYVNIDYTIRETNSRGNLVYPFYLAEGTTVPAKVTK